MAFIAFVGLIACSLGLRAQTCEPHWQPMLENGDQSVNSFVLALEEFDGGGGPALYAGGSFTDAGSQGAAWIARWDGASWSPLPEGLEGWVQELDVLDDGSGGGPALFVGGQFSLHLDDVLVSRCIAKWDGSSWSALGSGFEHTQTGSPWVDDIEAFDDGTGGGPAVYAAGTFNMAGGVPAINVAKWDGSTWQPVGIGMNSTVTALTVFDDGSGEGPALYAGGSFSVPARHIAKWDGSTWSQVGTGTIGPVYDLAVFDDGSGAGPALYAGGDFLTGGEEAAFIARWDSSGWTSLGGGVNGPVVVLKVLDDGTGGGPALFAGGEFTMAEGRAVNHVAKWDGSTWSPLGDGTSDTVEALATFDDGRGDGAKVFAGGAFNGAGSVVANYVAAWDGSEWSPPGPAGLDDVVRDLVAFDNGSGPKLYVGGRFETAGSVFANRIAAWDGVTWSSFGYGLSDEVFGLAFFDDGSGAGPELHATGKFLVSGGIVVNRIAKWNGAGWAKLGGGLNAIAQTLAVFDDGNGPALYVGGSFTTAGSVAANYIARWNGTNWAKLGSGTNNFVRCLTVFDDGNGPALYAGGYFSTAGGVSANRIARWDGTSWSALGSGMSGGGTVAAITVFDDGSGPALYAGGLFTSAGGVPANNIARWDGASWSALGSGTGGPSPTITDLMVFDDGSGPALYAGGFFTSAGGVAANRIAKWDGSTWAPLANGVTYNWIDTLTTFDDGRGDGPALYAGGGLFMAETDDRFLARWDGCPPPPPVWTDLASGLAGAAGIPGLAGMGALEGGSAGSLVLDDAVPSSLSILFVSLTGIATPFKCGTLVPLPATLQLSLVTSPSGGISLPWSSWPAGLSGLSLYFQYAIQDPSAVCGVALSNALRADVP